MCIRDSLEVVACCAAHFEHAQKKAQKYGIKACTYEEILSDDAIEMVVILKMCIRDRSGGIAGYVRY